MAIFTSETIYADLVPATGRAFEYVSGLHIVTFYKNVVRSLDDHAVFSDQFGSLFINDGSVLSAAAAGVHFEGDSSSITNNADRSITGFSSGIELLGDGATLNNHGTVSGLSDDGVFASSTSNNVVVNNDGEIYGHDAGISMLSDTSGGAIHNSGTIRGDQYGLSLDTESGLVTVIDNQAGGVIKGENTAILSFGHGAISLTNNGTISGAVYSNVASATDVIVNHGKITGQVFLGFGNDSFSGTSGTSGKVFGEDGNDTLIGGTHNDQIDGGAGIDLIRGGRGKDLLTGGADRDIFDFNSIKDSVSGSKRDHILDFQHGNNITGDDIDLRTIDAKIGVGGNQAFHFIGKQGFHDVKGELRYIDKGATCIVQGDVNGDGKADFEIFVNVGSLVKGDFLL